MRRLLAPKYLWPAAALLLGMTQQSLAQDIYRCTRAGQVEYTDHPCHGGKSELLHQADDSEIIAQYLDLGQDAQAKSYADAHHLGGLYQQLLDVHRQKLVLQEQQRVLNDAAARQRDAEAQQQAMMLYNARLQGENNALRAQNDAYADQASTPDYGYAPVYWGGFGPGWYREHDRGPHHPPPPPKTPPPKAPPMHLSPGSLQAKN